MAMKTPRIALAGLLLGAAMPALADVRSVEGPIPTGPNNQIYGAADVPGAKLSISLGQYGYVEEEYFLAGNGAVYKHGDKGLEQIKGDLPYKTRIIVRRPTDRAKFSGVVQYEPIHPSQGGMTHWLATNRYIMSRGDIYVAVATGDADSRGPHTVNPAAPVPQSVVTKWFNPTRYASLDWSTDAGIRLTIMSDVGKKLRSSDADNPLTGYPIRAMIVSGGSFTGTIQRVFINEGYHDQARMADGKPVFDGYLIGYSSRWNDPGYIEMYDKEPVVALDDPRRTLKPIDAAVIEFITEFEVATGPGPQAADSDAPIGRHRMYELGGVIHSTSLVEPQVLRRERPHYAQLLARRYPAANIREEGPACPVLTSDIPHGEINRAVLDNLRAWILEGKPPPHAEQLQWEGDRIARDDVGNPKGGVKTAEFAVPLARYGTYLGSENPGCLAGTAYPRYLRNPLTRQELVKRYRTPARYLSLYDAQIDRMVKERWLLPEDAAVLKEKAKAMAAQSF